MKAGVILAFLACTVATPAQTVQEWRDSLSVLNEQIAHHPRSTDLRLKKAAVNIELDQWEYAIEEYGRVLAIDPQNLSALYFRAYANQHLRRYDLARNDYEAFLAIMPRHFEAQLGLAIVNHSMGRNSEALDHLNTLVEMFPDSATAYAARANVEVEMHQYEPALYDWDQAIAREPGNLEFAVSKVQVLLSLNRKKEARRILKDLLGRGVPRSVLGEWLARSGM